MGAEIYDPVMMFNDHYGKLGGNCLFTNVTKKGGEPISFKVNRMNSNDLNAGINGIRNDGRF